MFGEEPKRCACGKKIGRSNTSGMCRPCVLKSPEYVAKDREYQENYKQLRKVRVDKTCGCGVKLFRHNQTGLCRACWKKSPRYREIMNKGARVHQLRWTPEYRVRFLVHCARQRAQKKSLPFAMTVADLLPLPVTCPVLGITIDYGSSIGGRASRGMSRDRRASIDRVVPSLGYVPGNVRVISYRANRLKGDGTPEELYAVAMDSMRMKGKPSLVS
jgi:hypothetical protein